MARNQNNLYDSLFLSNNLDKYIISIVSEYGSCIFPSPCNVSGKSYTRNIYSWIYVSKYIYLQHYTTGFHFSPIYTLVYTYIFNFSLTPARPS